jgi:anti-anti-sigma factor
MQAKVEIVGGAATIALSGRFDFSAHQAFREACAAALDAAQIGELKVDLAGVDYLDSSALGMLLLLREKAQAVNPKFPIALSAIALYAFGFPRESLVDSC